MACRQPGSAIAVMFVSIATAYIVHAQQIHLVHTQADLDRAAAIAASNRCDDIIKVALSAVLQPLELPREPGRQLTIESGYYDDFRSRLPSPFKGPGDKPKVRAELADSRLPERSTTGPMPPPGVSLNSKPERRIPLDGTTEVILGVPGYGWRHGCGPTSVGMICGYYDNLGYRDLLDGPATSQTAEVNQNIASERDALNPGHYEDYSCPLDASPTLLPDKSAAPAGDEHTSDSIADFMLTSWSSVSNYYGWTISSGVKPGFTNYVRMRNATYLFACAEYNISSTLTWTLLTNELVQARPMVFLVDTDGDNLTDHFVAVNGFRDTTNRQYGCLDTWGPPYDDMRWCAFTNKALGQPWGVSRGWSFRFNPWPTNSAIAAATLSDRTLTLQMTNLTLTTSNAIQSCADIAGATWSTEYVFTSATASATWSTNLPSGFTAIYYRVVSF